MNNDIGKRIAEFRRGKGLSQDELAELAMLNRVTVAKYETGKVEPGARILLVTSCIYVPFQLMKFTELALAKGIYVDCIGNKSKPGSPSVLNAASYLQELKATINAVYSLSERYF